MLAGWTSDPKPVYDAIHAAIGQTSEKQKGLLSCMTTLIVNYLKHHEPVREGVRGALYERVSPAPFPIEHRWHDHIPNDDHWGFQNGRPLPKV